ncbi:unnamed protein product [marine sediment metagenome]|uniref:Uncharacterized protein n=1 Tax=marine sediment metagenome TaxID=412755 RepID=X0YDQ1_9ZZZZ
MSYWSHNSELLDEVTIKALPEEWRNKVESDEIDLDDVPEDIWDKAMLEGTQDYWGTQIDEAEFKHEEEKT